MDNPEEAAATLLEEQGIAAIPTPVELIAGQLDIQVVYQSLEDEVSGLLYRDHQYRVIGVNATHARTRQRFTIAHELGHWRMHPGLDARVDRQVRVNFRRQAHWDVKEVEANKFAAALLMPRKAFTRARLEGIRQGGPSTNAAVQQLARLFRVSVQAMEYRLAELGIVDPA